MAPAYASRTRYPYWMFPTIQLPVIMAGIEQELVPKLALLARFDRERTELENAHYATGRPYEELADTQRYKTIEFWSHRCSNEIRDDRERIEILRGEIARRAALGDTDSDTVRIE